jgi:GTP cyclohydrolase IA
MKCCDHKNTEPKEKTLADFINQPISETIKQRLQDAGADFKSNTNISDHILPGELDLLQQEVASKFQSLLESLVIDTENDHNTNETAKRVAKMYIKEIFSGRYVEDPKITSFPNITKYDNLYVSGPISIRSTCAHHFQSIIGNCWVGIFPDSECIGLSKFNRIVHHVSNRPTIQEELSMQIADALEKFAKTPNIAVVIKAEHQCMTMRGVKEHENDFTTAIMRGKFREESLKTEFYNILNNMKGMN